jgi:predicted DNA-binding protein
MRKGTAKKVAKVSELMEGESDDVVVPMSIRTPRPLYDRLRKLSFDKRKHMTEYINRGIEMVLKAEKY